MFGFLCASGQELDEEQRMRYSSVYCGICRAIRQRHGQVARLGLRYDMAFLALLHMSLYEPEETSGDRACILHPIKPRAWLDCESIQYAADMNVALAYYKCLDDWQDDRKLSAKVMAESLKKRMSWLQERYPRQCQAIRDEIRELSELEKQQCQQIDPLANRFGRLMGEILVYREDLWAPRLRQVGFYLGRAIYLADAVADYAQDKKDGKFNPLPETDPAVWDGYLTMALGRCTAIYEQLPLVQDKAILDNILYSGIWVGLRRSRHKEDKG